MCGDQRVFFFPIHYHDHRGYGQRGHRFPDAANGLVMNNSQSLVSPSSVSSLLTLRGEIAICTFHAPEAHNQVTVKEIATPSNLIVGEFTTLCWVAFLAVLGHRGLMGHRMNMLGRGFPLLANSAGVQRLAVARNMFSQDKKICPGGSCHSAIRKLRQDDRLQIQGQPGLF